MSRRRRFQQLEENDPVQVMSSEGRVSNSLVEMVFDIIKVDKPAAIEWWDKECPGIIEALSEALEREPSLKNRLFQGGLWAASSLINTLGRVLINRYVKD